MSRNYGTTLFELLITLSLVGILVTTGLPSFYTLINNNRLTYVSNTMLASFYLTRSEAIKRNTRITMAAKSGDWASGWQIFVDQDADAVIDPGQQVILDQPPLNDSITISSNVAHIDSYISYLSNGLNRTLDGALQIGRFTICSNSSIAEVRPRSLVVNYSGRWRVAEANQANCN